MITAIIGYGKVANAIIDNYNIDTCLVRKLSTSVCSSVTQKCVIVNSYDKLPKADLYILAVNDDAIEEALKELQKNIPQNSVVAHCSGSVSLDLVSNYFQNSAIIYPLYPFAKGIKVNFDDITVLIECANEFSKTKAMSFVSQRKCFVNIVDSTTRSKIHIAAIFACNFTNHLVALSEQYLNEFGYDISILSPLLKRVVENITDSNGMVKNLQTGPAARKDYNIIDSHIKTLQNNPEMLDIYKYLTNSIIEHKNGNKKL